MQRTKKKEGRKRDRESGVSLPHEGGSGSAGQIHRRAFDGFHMPRSLFSVYASPLVSGLPLQARDSVFRFDLSGRDTSRFSADRVLRRWWVLLRFTTASIQLRPICNSHLAAEAPCTSPRARCHFSMMQKDFAVAIGEGEPRVTRPGLDQSECRVVSRVKGRVRSYPEVWKVRSIGFLVLSHRSTHEEYRGGSRSEYIFVFQSSALLCCDEMLARRGKSWILMTVTNRHPTA